MVTFTILEKDEE